CSRMDAASSRRKQSRPARIEDDDDVSETSADPGTPRTPPEGESVVRQDDDLSESSPVEFRAAGVVLGPIKVRRLTSPLDVTRGAIATLVDASGNALFFEVAADERLLTTVRPTASIDDANCVVMEEAPDRLRLMMTKSVPVTDTLIALFITSSSAATAGGGVGEERERSTSGEPADNNVRGRQRLISDAATEEVAARRQGETKKYLCDQCGLVSFNSMDNLRAHQSSYCMRRDGEQGSRRNTPAPSMTPRPASSVFPAPMAALFAAAAAAGGLQQRLQLQPAPQLMPGLLLPPPPPSLLASAPVMPAPLPHAAPNVIYLPIGYHDIPPGPSGSVVQMLGQPQTIVPIAVPRPVTGGAPLLPHLASSLAVHPAMCGAIPIPASLQLMAGDVITTIPVMAAPTTVSQQPKDHAAPPLTPHPTQRPPLQLAVPRASPSKRRQSATVVTRSSPALDFSSASTLKRRRTHTDNESTSPMEALLGKHSSSSSASSSKCSPHRLTPQSPAATAATLDCSPAGTPGSDSGTAAPLPQPRPFPCECGIGFSTEATLLAHKTTYCKLTPRKNEENGTGKEQKRPPPKCAQCGHQPVSASQLAVHMRNHHAEAFICNLCGYRGFSVRGIRSHLRTHPELDVVRFDDLLGLHVTRSAYVKGRSIPSPERVTMTVEECIQTLVDA
ncbi:hypothetical protein PENTCL1PPCAC_23982, partial [Pristionchus entomophagus]